MWGVWVFKIGNNLIVSISFVGLFIYCHKFIHLEGNCCIVWGWCGTEWSVGWLVWEETFCLCVRGWGDEDVVVCCEFTFVENFAAK
jgi:hypothetical protein